jgi:hypothetical protein
MDWASAPGYWLSRLVFQRTLAFVYAVAFFVSLNQFRPLLGAGGILPIPAFLETQTFKKSPSIFHLHYSDRFFAAVAWTGLALAAAAVVGLPDRAPAGLAMLVWALLWALYLSILNVGQVWYSFGWESLLVETGFLAIFLGPSSSAAPPMLILWLLRWVLFRLEFGAGLIKLRGDRCWRDLTCLFYHHETQPMPNPFSRLFHRLPGRVHKMEVLGNHFAQLIAPICLFLPQPFAGMAALVMIATQCWLLLSGNFSWLNLLTITLALSVLDDSVLHHVVPASSPPIPAPVPVWQQALVAAVFVVVAWLSYRPARNLFSRRQLMNYSFNRLHLVNTYGAFGTVTKVRYEVVIEGTDEPSVTPATQWNEYEFKGKPGCPERRAPQVAPYHLRLDWLMWFAALSPGYPPSWFAPFIVKLLKGDRDTLGLLRFNPFPDSAPTFVRARLYQYRFTTREERRSTGAWWHRTLIGDYVPPVGLRPESGPDSSEIGRPGAGGPPQTATGGNEL